MRKTNKKSEETFDYDTYDTSSEETAEEIADKNDGFRKLTKEERETIVNYSELDGKWYIDSSVSAHIKKLDKLGYKCVNTQYYPDGTVEAKQYECPKFAVSFRKPEKVKREMSEEQKLAMSERVKAMHEAKRKNKNNDTEDDEI